MRPSLESIYAKAQRQTGCVKAGAPIGNKNASGKHERFEGETDYGYEVRVHEMKPREQLEKEYEAHFKSTTGAPPFGRWHKSATKRQLAAAMVQGDRNKF